MRRSELEEIAQAQELTGFGDINDALMSAQRVASSVQDATKIHIDIKDPTASMRNFTKVLDGMRQFHGARTYALVEWSDDSQEGK